MPVIGRGGSNPPSDTPVRWPHRTPCDSPTPRTTQQVDTRTEPLDSAPLAAVTLHHQEQSGQGCDDTSDPVSTEAGRAAIGEPVAPPITRHMTPVPAADHRAPVSTSAAAVPVSSESATTPITAPMTTFTPPPQPGPPLGGVGSPLLDRYAHSPPMLGGIRADAQPEITPLAALRGWTRTRVCESGRLWISRRHYTCERYRLLVFGSVLVLQPVTGDNADAVTATATDDRLTLPKPVRVRLGWSTPSDVVMAIYDDDRLAVLPAAALDSSLDALIAQHTIPPQPPSLWVSDQPPHIGDNHD